MAIVTISGALDKRWNLDLYSTYASTEVATAFTECSLKSGGHLIPELAILEVLDEFGNEVYTRKRPAERIQSFE